MKIKKKVETLGIRIEPTKKQEILKFAYDNKMSMTDVIIHGFNALKKQGGYYYREEGDYIECQEKSDNA